MHNLIIKWWQFYSIERKVIFSKRFFFNSLICVTFFLEPHIQFSCLSSILWILFLSQMIQISSNFFSLFISCFFLSFFPPFLKISWFLVSFEFNSQANKRRNERTNVRRIIRILLICVQWSLFNLSLTNEVMRNSATHLQQHQRAGGEHTQKR